MFFFLLFWVEMREFCPPGHFLERITIRPGGGGGMSGGMKSGEGGFFPTSYNYNAMRLTKISTCHVYLTGDYCPFFLLDGLQVTLLI